MESMTGFGRAEASGDGFILTVEAKSVNHKSLSIYLKLPEVLSDIELEIRKVINGMFERGRIRLNVDIELNGEGGSSVSINMDSARQYIAAAEQISKDSEYISEMSAGELLNLPGVAERACPAMLDRGELTEAFRLAVIKALNELRESRRREGAVLAPLFLEGFTGIRELADPVLARQKENVQERYGRLKERVFELMNDVRLDEDRLMNELALLADRSDVTEEVHRLECHLDHALEIVDSHNSPIGRKLEFIIQEMHRELNTMGAKVDDPEQSLRVIEMKNTVSSLKEQAANIE
ncbi:MAG: YicC family protein [Candidatus Aegiribacteria sp.]|nr:YicC family protein [Candidatus Aegiribacteria sp.]